MWRIFALFAALLVASPLSAQDGDPVAADSGIASKTLAAPAEITRDEAAIAEAWGYDRSDLPRDPAVRYGLLPNGMRYAIRHNETPQGTAVMRLLIQTGSTAEAEDERGLAHFIEHMAFNGTTNVPEGEMVKILERLGLAFGADTNAYTGFEETAYLLDLPNVRDETVDAALFLLRETASEISFDPQAIDRERGIILSEMRARQNYAQRNNEAYYAFLMPGTRIADRQPIGTAEVIETVPAQTFRRFYDRYYTPGRATLVIVGDLDVDAMERQIHDRFASWQARNGEADKVVPGTLDITRRNLAADFAHPAIQEMVSVIGAKPWEDISDSLESRRTNLLKSLAYNIISRRMASKAREADPPFNAASLGTDDSFEMARLSILRVATRDGEWQRGLAAAEQIVRAALQYGFTRAELDEQLANYTTGFENAVGGAATRRSDGLAEQLLATARDGLVVTTPESQLERYLDWRDRITPEMVLQALREDMASLDEPLIYASSKEGLAGGSDALLATWTQSRNVTVAPPEEKGAAQFAYSDFGSPGEIVADSRIEDLDIRTVRFANNVRLNIKRTDFEKDRVRMSLRIDGGDLLSTREDPEATSLMNIFVRGGLREHSLDDLFSIFAGRSVAFSFGSGDDYFGSYIRTTPADLGAQFQLLAAYVTEPGYRPEAITQYRNYLPDFFARLDATPESTISSKIGAILSDDDPRFSLAAQTVFANLTFEELRAAISDRLEHGAIEIGIVGDVDEQAAIDMVAATFGALPLREAEFRDYSTQKQRGFTGDRSIRTLHHKGEADQAVVDFYWPTTDAGDFQTDVRLRLLAELLQLKVTDEIRERLGASYSPSASSYTSSLYPGYGYIRISTNVRPQDVDEVTEAVRHIAAELSRPAEEDMPGPEDDAISRDEMTRARNPLLENLALSLRENSAWLSIVDEAQSAAWKIDRFRASSGAISAIDSAELLALARQYLAPDQALVIRALPEPPNIASAGKADSASR
ncbi:MAG: insulinase family protein [Blastomonas sp.]